MEMQWKGLYSSRKKSTQVHTEKNIRSSEDVVVPLRTSQRPCGMETQIRYHGFTHATPPPLPYLTT